MIYLDNAATTRPCPEAVDAMDRCMREEFFNPAAAYRPAAQVEQAMDRCRALLRERLGARGHDVVFTSGGTESNALALLGSVLIGQRKQRILISAVEHPAVYEAGRCLGELGHRVEWIPVDTQGRPCLDAFARMLDTPADLVSVMHVNNETGTVMPLGEISEILRSKGSKARLHVDGVQGFLRCPVDLSLYGIGFYSLSAHKIGGPKGIGALLLQKGTVLKPLLPGGGQEGGRRSGTENVPGILGMAAAVEAYPDEAAQKDMRENKVFLWEKLREGIAGLTVHGPDPDSEASAPHILNVAFPGVRGEVMLHALEASGVYVSTGSACSAKTRKGNRVLAAMGIAPDLQEGAVRFSLAPENTRAQMEEAASRSIEAYHQFKRYRRR